MDLASLDQERVAVILRNANPDRILFGIGAYRRQSDTSPELLLQLDGASQLTDFTAAIVLREDEWDGEILDGSEHGCAHRIELHVEV